MYLWVESFGTLHMPVTVVPIAKCNMGMDILTACDTECHQLLRGYASSQQRIQAITVGVWLLPTTSGTQVPTGFSTKAVQYTRWGKETLIQDLVQARLFHITLSQPNDVLLQTFHTWPQFSAGGGEFCVMPWEEDSWKVSSRHLLCTCSFYTLYLFTAVSS